MVISCCSSFSCSSFWALGHQRDPAWPQKQIKRNSSWPTGGGHRSRLLDFLLNKNNRNPLRLFLCHAHNMALTEAQVISKVKDQCHLYSAGSHHSLKMFQVENRCRQPGFPCLVLAPGCGSEAFQVVHQTCHRSFKFHGLSLRSCCIDLRGWN